MRSTIAASTDIRWSSKACSSNDHEEVYQQSPRDAALQWFRDAKYGLFMHFGLYSLDGIGVRYQMGRALKPYWDFDPIPVKEYEQLMHRWKIEKFDADFIADLAVKSGMRYVTDSRPTAVISIPNHLHD